MKGLQEMEINTLISKDSKKTQIHYKILNENFYSSIRREITEKRLSYLSEASKKLPLPSLFGKFTSDSHYLATVDLFIKATEETRNRGTFFLKQIIPSLQSYGKLLDIGPGNGMLTKWVGRKFKDITLIDPVPQVLENILPSFFSKKTALKKINQSFLQTILPKNYFDLIILSHVIYHFPEEKWIDVVKKALVSLKPNGILAIVINSGLDREKLGDNFKGKTYPIEDLILKSSQLNKKIEIFSSRESFYAKDLTTMLHICGLHLHDLKGEAVQNDLEKYIKSNYLLGEDTYKMEMFQHFIIIKNDPIENY
ncbi:class I SAM-dependent methyltransferase [Candidatus Paracaedibacter symbiosus]|uniref:class I SAM-dependent methyltransferase n=1 Tax=Candidatus Paracaedibacter symbiosus TaxID=244582 RepID=UPI0005094F1A|nr:class I SAM-dependent methyltransferase [Candidatus Paracaedibacter symbiosus]